MTSISDLAAATPDSRNRYVDALRAGSILVVVFGHWLMAGPEMLPDGSVRVGHLVAASGVVQALTWVFQVMPVFFFVGGFANAAGWRGARERGQSYPSWLRARLRRLVMPVLPLLALWAAAGSAVVAAGVDPDLVQAGSRAALVPVWFLATYVITVAVVPLTLAAWTRYGWALPAGLTLAAVAVDVATLGFGLEPVRWLNYLFVWNAVHALGYAWADGRIGGTRRRLLTGVSGFALLAALVAALPYPLAMVGLDTATVTNSNPPKVTLILLGLFQFGILTSLEGPARRMLEGRRAWTAVVAVSAFIMTLYLWHLTVMVAVLGAQIALGGFGLRQTVATPGWWLTRPIFLAVLAALTLGAVRVFGRFERPRSDARPDPAPWRPLVGTVLVCVGLADLAASGVVREGRLALVTLTLPFVGVVLGGIVGAGAHARRTAATRS